MKKNRPGVLLTVLIAPDLLLPVEEFLFRETTTFGLRMSEKKRSILDREFREIETVYGKISIKLGLRQGEIVQRAPEFESCRKLAESQQVSIREVFAAAQFAAQKL